MFSFIYTSAAVFRFLFVTRSFNNVITGCDPILCISTFMYLGGLFLFVTRSINNVITNLRISTFVYIPAVTILDAVQT